MQKHFTNEPPAATPDPWALRRRQLIQGGLAGAAALALRPLLAASAPADLAAPGASAPTRLAVVRRTIEVDGRAASVYGIRQPDGSPGIRLREGDPFNVVLRNETSDPAIVHWHGLTPPWPSDGVPDAPLPLIAASASRSFDFPVGSAGTYWMHAHTLQEQQLLAAPLIVTEREQAQRDEQDVVVMLHDFSFRSPEELLGQLTRARSPAATGRQAGSGHAMQGGAMAGMDMSGMDMSGMDMSSGQHGAMGGMASDLNDIDFDAYLTNDRTLADPEIVPVERGGQVRLRIINGATATAFTVDLGRLQGTLLTVDGQPVEPVTARRFPLAMAQRIDVRLQLPRQAGAFPVLALREGARERTGIVLRTAGAAVSRLAAAGDRPGPVLDLGLEARLRARAPLAARPVDKTFVTTLAGDMAAYQWKLETQPRLRVDYGDRVEVTLRNATMMAHPVHLHGHRFQVVAIDGRRFPGAVRDTVLAPPGRSVTLAVDADNVGQWAFHCHHLYHMATGMMTTFAYNT